MHDSSNNDKKSHDSLYTTELVIGLSILRWTCLNQATAENLWYINWSHHNVSRLDNEKLPSVCSSSPYCGIDAIKLNRTTLWNNRCKIIFTYSWGSRPLWIRPFCFERNISISSSLTLEDAMGAAVVEVDKGKEEASDVSLTVAEISWQRKSISPCLIKRKKSNKATWLGTIWMKPLFIDILNTKRTKCPPRWVLYFSCFISFFIQCPTTFGKRKFFWNLRKQ